MANVDHIIQLPEQSKRKFKPYYFLRDTSIITATAFLSIFIYIGFSKGYVEKLFYTLLDSPFKAFLFSLAVIFTITVNIYFFRQYAQQERKRRTLYDELISSLDDEHDRETSLD